MREKSCVSLTMHYALDCTCSNALLCTVCEVARGITGVKVFFVRIKCLANFNHFESSFFFTFTYSFSFFSSCWRFSSNLVILTCCSFLLFDCDVWNGTKEVTCPFIPIQDSFFLNLESIEIPTFLSRFCALMIFLWFLGSV